MEKRDEELNFQSLVERKLSPVGSMGNDVIYLCPKCDDKSGHLYIDYNKNYWHCFRCGIGGKRIEGLLKMLDISLDYDYSKLYDEREDSLSAILKMKSKSPVARVVDYSNDLRVLTEYYYQHTMCLSNTAYSYLLDRGLNPTIISKLSISEGMNRFGEKIVINNKEYIGRDYSGRIMIPSRRRDGLISFYVGRDYTGTKEPKYLNPPKELGAASEDVWNLDIIDSDSVIICEGVFTAIHASPIKFNAVATYGKSIASKTNTDAGLSVTSQGEKLLAKKFKNYYVAYDADAHEEAVKSCKYLYDRGANVYLVKIDPKKYGAKADVADIGYSEFLKLMKDAIHYEGDISSL